MRQNRLPRLAATAFSLSTSHAAFGLCAATGGISSLLRPSRLPSAIASRFIRLASIARSAAATQASTSVPARGTMS